MNIECACCHFYNNICCEMKISKLSFFLSFYLHFALFGYSHKVQSVCLLVRIGTPQPLSRSVFPPPPRNQRGRGPACVRGGGPKFGRLEKKPSKLCPLCGYNVVFTTTLNEKLSIEGEHRIFELIRTRHRILRFMIPISNFFQNNFCLLILALFANFKAKR
jgi:hypothetical protein